MELNLVTEAFKFMLLGMSIVFSFLVIMIFTLKTQTIIIEKFFSKKESKNIDNTKSRNLNSNNLKKNCCNNCCNKIS